MARYEYTVLPAPLRGEKAKGLKSPSERFAHTIALEINRMASEGWEYVRAEVLPSEERSGLTGRSTLYHNLLVFRRPQPALAIPETSRHTAAPQPEYPVTATPMAQPEAAPETPQAAAPQPTPAHLDPGLAAPPAPRLPPVQD